MTLEFPNPATQTTYTYQGVTYLWDGIAWHIESQNFLNTLQPASVAELVYILTAELGVVDLGTPDENGNTYTLTQEPPGEAIEVHLDGLKVVEGIDFTVSRATNSITFPADLPVSTQVLISVLTPRSELAPGAMDSFLILDLDIDWTTVGNPSGMIDGVRTIFEPHYQDPATLEVNPISTNSEALAIQIGGVRQEPGVDYTMSGSTLTFAIAPQPNTGLWGVYYRAMAPGNGYTLLSHGTTAQRDAIVAPEAGIRVNSDTGVLEFYNGSAWLTVATV